MQWYVYSENASSGPFSLEELRPILKPADFVARVGSTSWTEASSDPELAPLFGLSAAPLESVPEWFIIPKGKPARGQFTDRAIINMIRKNTVDAEDQIRHRSWEKGVAIREMKFFKRLSSGTRDDEFVPSDWDKPGESAASVPTSSAAASRPEAAGHKLKRHYADFLDMGWKIKAAAALLCILPAVGFFGYKFFYEGSDMAIRMQYGTASGDCKADEVSKRLCGEASPGQCGCKPKGGCGMPNCVYWGKVAGPSASR